MQLDAETEKLVYDYFDAVAIADQAMSKRHALSRDLTTAQDNESIAAARCRKLDHDLCARLKSLARQHLDKPKP